MHLVVALEGQLQVKLGSQWTAAAGVLTSSGVPHALDGSAGRVLLVFLDPQSAVGAALQQTYAPPARLLTGKERDALASWDPMRVMLDSGEWIRHAVEVLGGSALPAQRAVHPKVRKVLRRLRELRPDDDLSLAALAAEARLSPSRLMHTFTESVGIPLRPYIAWLKLQRAAAGIVGGMMLGEAAHAAGFADAAHMSRTFRQMFGVTPSSMLQPAASSPGR
jgi:AraC-like DNA-binding protein